MPPTKERSVALQGKQPAKRAAAFDVDAQMQPQARKPAFDVDATRATPQQRAPQGAPPQQRAQRGEQGQAVGMQQVILPKIDLQEPPQASLQKRRKKQRAQKPQAKQHRITRGEARRRSFRKRLLTFVILLLVITAGVALSVTVLFKIDKFVFEGDSTYSQEDLLLAFGLPKGENIFSFKIADIESRMSEALPYAELITVRRRLPTTIVITVKMAQETYYTNCTDGGYAVLSAGLKVLRLTQEPVQDKPFIKGIEPVLPKAGATLEYPSEEKKAAVERTLQALQAQGIESFAEIDVSNTLEITFLYEKRARVLLGTSNALEDKLALAYNVLTEQIGASEHGTLDVSHQSEDKGRQGIWTPGVP